MRQSIPQSIILSTKELDISEWPRLSLLEPNVSQLETHIDNLHIRPESSIGIDQIREVKQFLQTKPLANFKVVFIHQAHTMTLQAQNATLKILEEPPSQGYIILITPNPFTLLPTIRSRCTIFSRESTEKPLSNYLSEITSLRISQRMSFADKHTQNLHSAQEFLESLVHECRSVMLEKPSNQALFNCLVTLHGLKLISANTNPKLVVDYVLFRLKAV